MEQIKKFENDIVKFLSIAVIIEMLYLFLDHKTSLGEDIFTGIVCAGIYYWIASGVKNKNINSIKTLLNISFGLYITCIIIFTLSLIGYLGLLSGYAEEEMITSLLFLTISAVFFVIAIYRVRRFINNKVYGINCNVSLEAEIYGFETMYIFYATCIVIVELVYGDFIGAILVMACSYFELQAYKTLIYWINEITIKVEEENKEKVLLEAKKINTTDISEKVEILKGYKELLDNGIISQEEFDKKKDEIL